MTQEIRDQICAALYEPVEWTPALQELLDERREQHKQELLAEAGEEIAERLRMAIAKEEALERLIALQKQWVKELVAEGESTGQLVGADEAAKSLDLAPATLRYYAIQGLIPCFKMGRNRKYNLKEIKEALEKARQEGKVSRVTDAMRKRILR